MPRTRQIKHSFFLNEDLSALDPYARLLFAGLWILADREGRLDDRPAKIKAQIFPYNEVDIEGLLLQLACGFITRYSCGGVRYISVNSFKVHQHCHKDEKDSTIPSPKNAKKIRIATSVHPPSQPGKPTHKNAYKPVSLISNPVSVIAAAPPVAEIVKPETPIQAVVRAYKHAKGVDQDSKAWDKANFGRAAKAAKNLLARFDGNVQKCAAYIFMRAEDLNEKNLEWTIETIARHAFDGMGMPNTEGDQDGLKDKPMGSDRLDGPRSTRRSTPSREIAGDALRSLEHAAVRAEGNGDLGGEREDSRCDEDYEA